MKLNLTFAGFYNSIHSEAIDNNIESDSESVDLIIADFLVTNELYYYELFDYKQTYINYSKDFLSGFETFLKDELYTTIKINFIALDNPKFYNYRTDTLDVEIKNIEQLQELEKNVFNEEYFKDNFLNYIKQKTTSCDGYISYYKFDDVMNKIDDEHTNVFYSLLLSSLIKLYEGDLFDISYFNFYEVESVVKPEFQNLFLNLF